MSKWTEWYDSLPPHVRQSLDKQPLWHDIDLLKVFLVGLVVGFIIGVAI